MGSDETGTLARLKVLRRELIDPKIADHWGRIVKTMGDGLLVEYPSVVEAVACALAIQREMAQHYAATQAERIQFRVGINVGDIIIDEGDIYGDGVNVAARLEALAEPGGICVSGAVHDQVHDKLDAPFEDCGERALHNISAPVRVYRVRTDGVAARVASSPAIAASPTGAVAELPPTPSPQRIGPQLAFAVAAIALVAVAFAAWWTWSGKDRPGAATMTLSETTPAPPLSIVVLPFQNLSGDPDQEYLADGVTDDLTSDLSRIAGSFVISRTTAFTYKGKPVDVKGIGRDLGVRYVLEGSVRRSGNQVHVNVQLINAATEAHVWADQFDTDRANLVEAQTEITSRLANTLNVALVHDADSRIAEQRRADPNAQDLVMRGRSLRFRTQSGEAQKQAEQAFARALQIDPRSIDAKIGLAWSLLTSSVGAMGSLPQPNEARAQGLLQEVLDREQDNASGHAAMGLLRINQKRFTEARIELETALQLDPNDADAARNLGWTLFYLGEFSAARNQAEKVVRLNPRDPYIFSTYDLLGACEMSAGHFAAAAGFYVKSRAANPRIFITRLALAAALAMQGDLDGGKAELAIARKLKPDANSLAIFRDRPCTANRVCREAREKSLFEGLRRLGFPEN